MFLNQQDITKPELAKTPIATFIRWLTACILVTASRGLWVGGGGLPRGGTNLELDYTPLVWLMHL